jgi:3'(2'), 5'-bisphosphate nucleotidase
MPLIDTDQDQRIRQFLRECTHPIRALDRQQFEVMQKGIDDYVTSVDLALDQQLLAAFTAFFPKDGIITEERAYSWQEFTSGYNRLWCIDPIDGTEEFIQGKPSYAVMVGLLENQQPIAGWIYAPASDRLWWGGANWGLFESLADSTATALAIAQPPPPLSDFCPVIIGRRDEATFGAAILEQIPAAQFSFLGSFGLKVLEVIQGKAGLYLYLNRRVKVWDTCAPLALAKAAGLICCDLDGQPIRFSPDSLDLATLTHNQPILVGWANYIELLRPKLQVAFNQVRNVG